MDEEIKETSKKISRKRIREEQEKKQKSFADKLETAEDKRTHIGEKLRSGKKDVGETREELLENTRIKKQNRVMSSKRTYEIVAEAKHSVIQTNSADNKQENNEDVSARVADEAYTDINLVSVNTLHQTKNKYGDKLHDKIMSTNMKEERGNIQSSKSSSETEANAVYYKKIKSGAEKGNDTPVNISKEIQKEKLKKKSQYENYKKRSGEPGNSIGGKIKAFFEETGRKIIAKTSENPFGAVFAVVGLIIVLVTCGMISSCSLLGGGAGDASIATTFTAHDEDILNTDDDYMELEEALGEYIENFEANKPGYDEYVYVLDEIGHNPFELAALLTVLYEDYTEGEVQAILETIFEIQYVITEDESTETRIKTVLNEETGEYEEVEYEAKIMTLSVANNGISEVAGSIGLDEDEIARYELLIETYGNKKYLFEDDIYAVIDRGAFGNYRIPAEHLTDAEFAKLIHEAEKYLGTDYVWGGSEPDTGFDCSGFVGYVLNHSGNGINVGRPTVSSLANMCAQVSKSEAKPGDLIFFKNTYTGAPSGASHVGIYVGDGMMIHCGNPVQYTSIETPFWQNHLYGYGRLGQEE